MRYLRDHHIKELAEPGEVLEWMRLLFMEMGNGSVLLPDRTVVPVGKGSLLAMPGVVGQAGAAGIKVVSVFPHNPKQNLPSIHAELVLIDPETGKTSAVMSATSITALRTAAVSALAADFLARKNATRLGIFGAGVQAEYHVMAFRGIRALSEIMVFDPDQERARKFADRINAATENQGLAHTGRDAKDVVQNSDIVVTATTSKVPVFAGADLLPGTHVGAIGSFEPSVRELDDETIERAYVVVDSKPHALAEAGDLIVPLKSGRITEDHVKADLAELVSGTKKGRTGEEQITVFKSVGLAAEDLMVAKQIVEKADRQNVGIIIKDAP